ncbi:MAG: GntR family transcriptional regulator [Novosphingobium sp.]|nr:GntR family transcriptional regulator [Novosphingobium sp.]
MRDGKFPSPTAAARPEDRFRKASQVVADALRYEIGMGTIADNDALPPEAELIERFGVSRPTLREAIRILETEGLLTTARGGNKGHRIHHPSARQAARQASLALRLRGASMMDVFVLASILVPPAVRMAAEMDPKPDFGELFRLHGLMAGCRDRPRELTRLIRQFDAAVCELCGNEAIAFVSRMMAEIIELQIEEVPAETAELPPENAAEIAPSWERFGKVLDAMASGDGPRAEELMQQRMRELVAYHARVMANSTPLRMIL